MGNNQRALEIAVGLFVIAGIGALLALAMRVSNITAFSGSERYTVVGYFDNVGGLKEKAPVDMAGVQVGQVSDIELDTKTFSARVELSIRSQYDNLPLDTSAGIRTSGLLGEQYIGLEPGGMRETLSDGDELRNTESALILEKLISKFMSNQMSDENN